MPDHPDRADQPDQAHRTGAEEPLTTPTAPPVPSVLPAVPSAVPSSQPGSIDRTGPPEHPSVTSFRAALREAGGQGEIVVLPDSVHTAALAAQALGCEVGAIANSLLFDCAGEPVLVMTSGAHRVDTAKVAADQGLAELRRATPQFVRGHTGQVIGGVSPLDHPSPVPTYLDRALARYDVIWAAAGHPAAVFSTTYEELLAMTRATEIEVR